MRVNNISSFGLNFTRGIEIVSDTNHYGLGGKIDDVTMNVIRAVQNQRSIYDKDTSRKISNFFRAQIGDISKNRVYPVRIENKIYIFTGKEAVSAKQLQLEAKKKKEELEKKRAEGPMPDMDIEERLIITDKGLFRIESQNIFLERDRKMLEMVEDGRRNRPETKIILKTDKRGRLKSAEYRSIKYADGKYGTLSKSLTL